MRTAFLRLALTFVATLLLASCTGRQVALLLPGQGPGDYNGEFKDDGGASLGTFTMSVDDTNVLHGSGTLNNYTVSVRGVLNVQGQVAAFITEEDSQRTGEFDGTFTGGGMNGTWEFDPTGTQTIQGVWTAVPKP